MRELRERIEEVLDRVRPHVRLDGGDLSLVDVSQDGVVSLKFSGGCLGCPMSRVAILAGLESALKEQVPEVQRVVVVKG